MNIKTALKKSIEHWENMVEWVKKQPMEDKVNYGYMFREIGQDIYDMSCPLCEKCSTNEVDLTDHYICEGCPLGKNDRCCEEWNVVNICSKTWKE